MSKEKKISTLNIKSPKSSILNPSFTFDSFVAKSSNQFAYTVALSISKKPAIAYNPFFLYAPTGLGKTHLIQAIGNESIKNGLSVIYTTSEQFIIDFISHLRNQTMDRFREKYRKCDILLIDDIHFLSGTFRAQEQFFHIFSELHSLGKQIVL